MGSRSDVRHVYFRRLLSRAAAYKALLALTLIAGVVSMLLAFVFPWLIGSVIDRVIAPARDSGVTPEQRLRWLWILIGVGAASALLYAGSYYVRGSCTVKLGNRIIADLRRDLFEHLQRLSLHFYSKERTGSIVSRLINDIQQAGALINGGVVMVVMDLVQTLVAIVLLFSISWKLALACVGVLPLYVLTFRVFNGRVRNASRRVQKQISKISGTVQERLAGIALVKSNAAEERERETFVRDTEEHYGRVVEQGNLSYLVAAISEGLIQIGTLIVLGYGSYLAVRGDPPLSAGEVTRFLFYLGIMYAPVQRFAQLNIVYQTSMAAIDRVFRVLDITPKIVEKRRAARSMPQRGEVRFEGVRFCYQDDSEESQTCLDDEDKDRDPTLERDPEEEEEKARARRAREASTNGNGDGQDRRRWILDGLDLHVAAGERVALVGPSGSGKSTVVSLLPRLYDVAEGRILIDGVDVRDYRLQPLRQAIAIVQQESMVFSGSIRENLAYGRPGATSDETVAAAKAANAHEFIEALPDGYETPLGERGVNLSGGQRQRISIARALLKNPRILILDEATSALDTESESLVQGALERLMRGRTSFIIAHRLSTVRGADRILVLDKGRIVESGPHEELLKLDGLYARLVRHQFARDGDAAASEPAPHLEAQHAAKRPTSRVRSAA